MGDQTAVAVPRIGLRGTAGVGLPQPLPPSEAGLVRRIFALQAAGSVAEAARETQKLQDDFLFGPILADRYLHTAYRPTSTELSTWLVRFGDQPEAPAIRELLERLAPAAVPDAGTAPVPRQTTPTAHRRENLSQTRALFVRNRDAEVVAAARPQLAATTAGSEAAEPLFVAGLASWRLKQGLTATTFFDAAYRLAPASTLRAASAFWAGHVEHQLADRSGSAVWMRRAALEGDTFYGLIARRTLSPPGACVDRGTIGNADVDALLATPQGRRAFGLLQADQKRYAEAELRDLWVNTAQDGVFDRSLVLVARAVGFSKLASEIEHSGFAARPGDTVPARLQPANGFLVDPPLVYALVRNESNFRSVAVSHSGARGLMQIMPRTAHAVAGDEASRLQDPAVNLSIGQQYLLSLAREDAIEGNLIRVLAGYTQGQGGLQKWVDAVHDDGDPLMFMEAIPNGHVRAFVEEALVHSWNYAAAMNLPATSLDALAAGHYPQLLRAGRAGSAAGACPRESAQR